MTATPADGGTAVSAIEDPGVSLQEDDDEHSEDRFEPNDSCDGATDADLGATYDGLTIQRDDEDYFAVELDEGQSLTASIDFSHDEGDLDMELVAPDGSAVDMSISTTDGETVSTVADESDTYCVRVYGFLGSAAGYDLAIRGDTE